MILPFAISVGVLFAAGTFMLMRRSFVKIVIGLALIGHASNLMIFTAGSPTLGRPAFIGKGQDQIVGSYSDPLPPALILTAIVIGFGIVSYTIVLIKRTYSDLGTDDVRQMTASEQ